MTSNSARFAVKRDSENARETVQTRWIDTHKEKPNARLRLFCFPYAGGSATIFRSWHEALPELIQDFAVQLPGRGSRLSEPPFRRLHEMVDALGHALSPFLDKPFAFFGHSMGAIISLELARWLRRERNIMPVHLFVSGRRAPQLVDSEPPNYDLPEPEFIEQLRRLNGTPKEVFDHPELMQLMIPLLRADFCVCETYRYKEGLPLSCPLTVLGGLGDVEVPIEQLEPWREHTTSSFSVQMFPGDHFFVHTAQSQIIRVIVQRLANRI